jgi:dihydroflavonol-4-reductase
VVHPTVVIGPNETHHIGIVQSLIFDYFAGALPACFGGGFNLVGVTDLAAGAMAAAERGKTGESYILGGRWYDVGEFLREAQQLSGTRLPRVTIPLWLARAGLPVVRTLSRITGKRPLYNREEIRQLQGNRKISCAKAERELGYNPRGLDDPLRMIHEEWLGLQSAGTRPNG